MLTSEPEPDEWTAADAVAHLFDVDIVYGFRWRLVLTEKEPTYPGYDEKKWTPVAASAVLAAAQRMGRAPAEQSDIASADSPYGMDPYRNLCGNGG